jgi:DamX protein
LWNSPSLNDKQTEIESLPEFLMAGIPAAAIPRQVEAQSANAPVHSAKMQEPAWLQTRDPKRYTLQLYRSRDLEGLKEFANNKLLPQPLVYYRSSSKKESSYFLVAGDYPDIQSAKAALAELTTQLPGLKPWIRDFAKLQAQLR